MLVAPVGDGLHAFCGSLYGGGGGGDRSVRTRSTAQFADVLLKHRARDLQAVSAQAFGNRLDGIPSFPQRCNLREEPMDGFPLGDRFGFVVRKVLEKFLDLCDIRLTDLCLSTHGGLLGVLERAGAFGLSGWFVAPGRPP
jgi:hypothetical protein